MNRSSLTRRALLRGGTVAVGVSIGAVGPVAGAKRSSITGCTTIDRPGYYVLESDVEGDGRSCIQIASGTSDVTIDGDGHAVKSGGVRASDSRNVIVKNLVVDGSISFTLVDDARITDVRAKGIDLQYCERVTVRRNVVTSNGIYLADAVNCDVSYNRSSGGSNGISVTGSETHGNRFHRNTLVDNKFSGIYYGDTLGIDYEGPILNLEFISSGDVIADNFAARNGEYGIAVGWSSDVTVSRNRAFDNRRGGIRFNGCHTVRLVGNRARGNRGDGVHISASHSAFAKNRVERNGGTGFAVVSSAGCRFEHNRALRNRGDGFSLVFTSGSRFERNRVLRNGGNGFALADSYENELRRNTVCRNRGEPFVISGMSRDNQIAGNSVCAV